jgi:dipeptidyl-peptidase-4
MTDTFPRQNARTRRFSLGAPRSFQISPDGSLVLFLRSKGGSDPVTCLWRLDVASGREQLVADPAALGAGGEEDPAERARRERSREKAAGIVAFSCDAGFRRAVFAVAGRVYTADLAGGEAVPAGTGPGGTGPGGTGPGGTGPGGTGPGGTGPGGAAVAGVAALAPAADPRPDPTGRRVAYVHEGALRVTDLGTGTDRVIADPEAAGISYGLAEFVAAEEMGRSRGYWWAPDGQAMLVARVDENPVQRWFIADPANPDRVPAQIRYPAAGTANAEVTLALMTLDGERTEVSWDRGAFPYLIEICWQAGGPPLLLVESRVQREMRILAVDAGTGGTTVVRADTNPYWLNVMPGVPARTAGGMIVWTSDAGGTRSLLIATAKELAEGRAEPVTPEGLQVREVFSVDGDTVLFSASTAQDPTTIGLWSCGEGGVTEVSAGPGCYTGWRSGGTTVTVSRTMDSHGAAARVHRDGQVTEVGSLAEYPVGPVPEPDIFAAGPHGIWTAIVLPSGHRPGSAKLPVLMSPYGGPHGQEVVASLTSFSTAQWLADQGFAVVVADGRGTLGRGPDWDHEVAGDLATAPLADQVDALHAAAERCADLDLSRVAIRGWSFGGYLSALAVLRRPDVFHAAVAGAPVTDFALYDTHYTERYLGQPGTEAAAYEACSLLTEAHRLSRPLLIVHGLADDNVAVAHSLRLSAALLAAGRPHSVLPLSGVTHMPTQEDVAENLLLLQVDFLRRSLRM